MEATAMVTAAGGVAVPPPRESVRRGSECGAGGVSAGEGGGAVGPSPGQLGSAMF